MVQILGGLITYWLMAIYCQDPAAVFHGREISRRALTTPVLWPFVFYMRLRLPSCNVKTLTRRARLWVKPRGPGFLHQTNGHPRETLRPLDRSDIDAYSVYMTNEPDIAAAKGLEPRLIRPINYGIDFYGDCLFSASAYIGSHPDAVASFKAASLNSISAESALKKGIRAFAYKPVVKAGLAKTIRKVLDENQMGTLS